MRSFLFRGAQRRGARNDRRPPALGGAPPSSRGKNRKSWSVSRFFLPFSEAERSGANAEKKKSGEEGGAPANSRQKPEERGAERNERRSGAVERTPPTVRRKALKEKRTERERQPTKAKGGKRESPLISRAVQPRTIYPKQIRSSFHTKLQSEAERSGAERSGAERSAIFRET